MFHNVLVLVLVDFTMFMWTRKLRRKEAIIEERSESIVEEVNREEATVDG